MQDYRLYYLGRDGKITRAEAFSAPAEKIALVRAAETKSPHGVELWQGDRKIGTFPAHTD